MAMESNAEELAHVSFPCSIVATDHTVLKLPLPHEMLLLVELVACSWGMLESLVDDRHGDVEVHRPSAVLPGYIHGISHRLN